MMGSDTKSAKNSAKGTLRQPTALEKKVILTAQETGVQLREKIITLIRKQLKPNQVLDEQDYELSFTNEFPNRRKSSAMQVGLAVMPNVATAEVVKIIVHLKVNPEKINHHSLGVALQGLDPKIENKEIGGHIAIKYEGVAVLEQATFHAVSTAKVSNMAKTAKSSTASNSGLPPASTKTAALTTDQVNTHNGVATVESSQPKKKKLNNILQVSTAAQNILRPQIIAALKASTLPNASLSNADYQISFESVEPNKQQDLDTPKKHKNKTLTITIKLSVNQTKVNVTTLNEQLARLNVAVPDYKGTITVGHEIKKITSPVVHIAPTVKTATTTPTQAANKHHTALQTTVIAALNSEIKRLQPNASGCFFLYGIRIASTKIKALEAIRDHMDKISNNDDQIKQIMLKILDGKDYLPVNVSAEKTNSALPLSYADLDKSQNPWTDNFLYAATFTSCYQHTTTYNNLQNVFNRCDGFEAFAAQQRANKAAIAKISNFDL